MALQFETALRCASRSGLFLAKFVLRISTSCYFLAPHQNPDLPIGFSEYNFLKKQ